MEALRLSVIIPVWNGKAFLPACLDALEAQREAIYEIVAVDNSSTDGSADLIAARYQHVRLFRNTQNRGFAQACNTGIQTATGEVLVLLNQDTQVEAGWSAALQTAFSAENDATVGVVGCKILSATDRTLQHAGGYVHELLGVPFHHGKGAPPVGTWDEPRPVEYVTGAAMAIRRAVLERIGLFDERFFPAYYEDIDLCFRARAAGFQVLYWPTASVWHHESTSTSDRTRWFYFQRGRIRFVLKHWPLERLLDGFAEAERGFQTTFQREFGSTRPLRLAYIAARCEAPQIAAERWPAGGGQLAQINALLSQLHVQALSHELSQVDSGLSLPEPPAVALQPPAGTLAESSASTPFILPPLQEFVFHAATPVVGPLLTLFRRAWHGVATKWAMRHLIEQQQAINQTIAGQLQRLEETTAALAAGQATTVQYCTEQTRQTQAYLTARETQAAAVNRFLLEALVQAEEEAIFALLWPLRWDLILNTGSPGEEAP